MAEVCYEVRSAHRRSHIEVRAWDARWWIRTCHTHVQSPHSVHAGRLRRYDLPSAISAHEHIRPSVTAARTQTAIRARFDVHANNDSNVAEYTNIHLRRR